MKNARDSARDYKQITLPQLRSFCEVARQGTMKAAAHNLDLAQPTVWKQIHALEQSLGVALIQSHSRGTQLTDAGRVLLKISGPAVNELSTLEARFAEQITGRNQTLIIAASPRVCQDDLPPVLAAFGKKFPHIDCALREMATDQIVPKIESGAAHIGLGDLDHSAVPEILQEALGYYLVATLVIAAKHPLAKKRQIELQDLAELNLLNAPDTFPCAQTNAALARVGAFKGRTRPIELIFAQTIRRYAQLGLGAGLIANVHGQTLKPQTLRPHTLRPHTLRPLPGTIEIELSNLFPLIPVHAVFQKQLHPTPAHEAFIKTLQSELLAPTPEV